MATYCNRAKEAGWKPAKTGRGAAAAGKSKAPEPAVIVRGLVTEAGDSLWVDTQGDAHVTFEIGVGDGVRRKLHASVDGSAYRSELCARYADAVPDKVLSKMQLDLAVGLLSHQAKNGGKHQTFLRSGMHEGALYIELGQLSGRAVRVHPLEGISIVDEPRSAFSTAARVWVSCPCLNPAGRSRISNGTII